ncbi:hypothetical protein Vadar_008229 [Vaccinium darrowii]|uniref:Uncharacterized protein n=1 Tax=Vaccinium darrowii TaxID=229202 RepID=A0ACB7YVZ4_9ERIC|nr:hypothetical protein Vadar_008229 [Vaccinium darrowii]
MGEIGGFICIIGVLVHQGFLESFAEGVNDGSRNYGKILVKDLEKWKTIILQPSASEWAWRSAIAKLKEITTPDAIQDAFSKVNFVGVKVRSMGGLFMIITFKSKRDRNKALGNNDIKGWFNSLKHWNGEGASSSRLIWLKCRGMPLNAWDLKSFRRISEIWGKFITIDHETLMEESFDVGRLLMVTECSTKIDQWINIIVKGRNYRVHVWEEECNDPFDVKGVNQVENHQSNPHVGVDEVSQAKTQAKVDEGSTSNVDNRVNVEECQEVKDGKVDVREKELANDLKALGEYKDKSVEQLEKVVVETYENVEVNNEDSAEFKGIEVAALVDPSTSNSHLKASPGVQLNIEMVDAQLDTRSSSLETGSSKVEGEMVLDSFGGNENSVEYQDTRMQHKSPLGDEPWSPSEDLPETK